MIKAVYGVFTLLSIDLILLILPIKFVFVLLKKEEACEKIKRSGRRKTY